MRLFVLNILQTLWKVAGFLSCDALPDLVLFVQLKTATLLKVTLLHGYFSRFSNCINDTKSRKASHNLFLVLVLSLFPKYTFFKTIFIFTIFHSKLKMQIPLTYLYQPSVFSMSSITNFVNKTVSVSIRCFRKRKFRKRLKTLTININNKFSSFERYHILSLILLYFVVEILCWGRGLSKNQQWLLKSNLKFF